jgi:gamma-glutamyltranspeptidase/glutathione hydrolase
LIQGEGNTVAAGKRPLSSMTPTIVTRGDRLVLVVGASGGPTIITGTLQVISNVLDFGLEAADAVARSRVHHQWVPEPLVVEQDLPEDVSRALRRRGHRIQVWPRLYTAVQLVLVRDGRLYGVSDPRKQGAPAGY